MAFGLGDAAGSGVAKGDASGAAAEAAGWTAVRPAVGRPRWGVLPEGRPLAPSFSGSRFWALEGIDSDNDDDEVCSQVSDGGSGGSPRPSAGCSVGDFIAHVEELGGSFVAGRRRAFAPGGQEGRRLAARIWRPPKGVDAGPEGRSCAIPEAGRRDLVLAEPPQAPSCSSEPTGVGDGGGGAGWAGDSRNLARVSGEPSAGPVSLLGQYDWPSPPGGGLGGLRWACRRPRPQARGVQRRALQLPGPEGGRGSPLCRGQPRQA